MGNLPITAPGMARGNQAKELGPEPASPPAHGLQDELTDGRKWGDGGRQRLFPRLAHRLFSPSSGFVFLFSDCLYLTLFPLPSALVQTLRFF